MPSETDSNIISSPSRPLAIASFHAGEVSRLIKERKDRAKLLPEKLFADPDWDILLELFAAHLGQVRIAISCLCRDTMVPPSTVLRWISVLDKEGLKTRRNDPFDQRRVFIGLTENGVDCMQSYVESNAVRA